jgi:LmbE family N-acetylglucosaminyl deacetylase
VLLAVFGHPDDEVLVSGVLVLAARGGMDVRTVYVTSGDAGQDRSGRGLSGPALRQERERELARALARLELPPPRLLRYPDGQVWTHREALQRDLSRIFEELRPGMVLTFGPDGVTGHADHIASGVAAAEVFDRTGIGGELWHFAVSGARAAVAGPRLTQFGVRGVDARRIHRTIDVRDAVSLRVAAMKTHRTQFPAAVQALLAEWFARLPADDLIRVRGIGEHRLPWERAGHALRDTPDPR